AEDGIRDGHVTGVQTCALPISSTQKETSRYPSGLAELVESYKPGTSRDLPAPSLYLMRHFGQTAHSPRTTLHRLWCDRDNILSLSTRIKVRYLAGREDQDWREAQ